jgi:hypothetical protein
MATNEIEKTDRELSAQETLFCSAYADPESETFGNASKSAELAKYSQPHNSGWKLKQREVIKNRLNQIYERNKAGVGKVMADLENERLLAIKKGDLSSAIRASELQGKRLGAFSDKHVFVAGEPQPAFDSEQTEEVRLACEWIAAKRYLADSAAKEIEAKIDARLGQARDEGRQANFSEANPSTPQGPDG